MTAPTTLSAVARLLGAELIAYYPRYSSQPYYVQALPTPSGLKHPIMSAWDLAGAVLERMREEPDSEYSLRLDDEFSLKRVWEMTPTAILEAAAAYQMAKEGK